MAIHAATVPAAAASTDNSNNHFGTRMPPPIDSFGPRPHYPSANGGVSSNNMAYTVPFDGNISTLSMGVNMDEHHATDGSDGVVGGQNKRKRFDHQDFGGSNLES